MQSIREFRRFTTPDFRCPYVPAERASHEYRIILELATDDYNELLRRGWRRFGCEFFRPVCARCTKCRSLRVRLDEPTLSRSQRRTLKRNAQIETVVQPPSLTAAHLRLFNAYHAFMHEVRGWPRHETNERNYFESFLFGEWSFAREFLYYDCGRLVGVGLADVTAEALSSIYFFHDPSWRPKAPGVFSVLQQTAYARRHGLRYHYLGYWIAESSAMAYKAQYRPHELLSWYPADDETPHWIKPDS